MSPSGFPISQPDQRCARQTAFTLIELMISIALVLLLMIGINQVFKVTGEAVGTGQAVSTTIRDARGAQAVMASDFAAWASDSPAIIIRSERMSAFRNKADELSDRDYVPGPAVEATKRTLDIDGNGTEGETSVVGEVISPAIYNHRSHRIDKISFFGRGLFRRQTGGGFSSPGVTYDEYISDMTSPEAWIWYGHLRRPDYTTPAAPSNAMEEYEHRDPGVNPAGTDRNENNFHAGNWILGRMAIALVEGEDTDSDGIPEVRDRSNRLQRLIYRDPNAAPESVQPLRDDARSNDSTSAAQQWQLRSGRYDLAATSIRQFTQILENNIALDPPEGWYDSMMNWRFQGDPTPARPLTPDNVARTTPVFLEHCSQFIVEFAGDFFNQNDDGSFNPPFNADGQSGDGKIDFLIDRSTGVPVQRIRWYGMPRDVAGSPTGGPDGIIKGADSDPNRLVDVLPLGDLIWSGLSMVPQNAVDPTMTIKFIERFFPWPSGQSSGPPAFYATQMPGPNQMRPDARYVVAWGPDSGQQPKPRLIRIIYTIDDPTGRIAEGQTFEYVFRVGN